MTVQLCSTLDCSCSNSANQVLHDWISRKLLLDLHALLKSYDKIWGTEACRELSGPYTALNPKLKAPRNYIETPVRSLGARSFMGL